MKIRAKKVISAALVCSSVASPLAYGEHVQAAMPDDFIAEKDPFIDGIVKDAVGRYFNPLTVIEGGLKKDPALFEKDETYTVKEGDVLGRIALHYGVEIEQIIAENNLTNAERLSIGQQLKIPLQKYHRVEEGETLEEIADKLDVEMDDLVTANAAQPLYSDALYVGQPILIPEKPLETMSRAFSYKPKDGTVQIASRSSAVSSKGVGSIAVSFDWPLQGIITSKFGWRSGKMHQGLDISDTNKSATIRAARDGVVKTAERNSGGYGLLVVIDHGNGIETWYAHMSKLSVSEGDQVNAGDPIGKMGNTGDSHGAHLHFEVRKDGTAVNPLAYLPKK